MVAFLLLVLKTSVQDGGRIRSVIAQDCLGPVSEVVRYLQQYRLTSYFSGTTKGKRKRSVMLWESLGEP